MTRCLPFALLLVLAGVVATAQQRGSDLPPLFDKPQGDQTIHATKPPPDPLAGDGRLTKPLDLAERVVSLEDLTKAMSKQLGVKLETNVDTRDLKAAIFIRHLPAKQVMAGLAKTFDLTWERTGKKPEWKYSLYQSLAQKKRQNDMAAYVARHMREDMDRWLKQASDTLPSDPVSEAKRVGEINDKLRGLFTDYPPGWREESEKLMKERGGWGGTPLDYALGYVGKQLTPGQVDAFWNGQDVVAGRGGDPALTLPPQFAEVTKQERLRQLEQSKTSAANAGHDTSSIDREIAATSSRDHSLASFSLHYDEQQSAVMATFEYADGRTESTGSAFTTGLAENEPLDTLHNAGVDWNIPTEDDNAREELTKDEALQAKLTEPATKPDEYVPGNGFPIMGDFVAWLFARSKLSYIAEGGRRFLQIPGPSAPLTTIAHYFQAHPTNRHVSRDGDIVLLRNRAYFRERLQEYPERLLTPLMAAAVTDKGISLDDWASFASKLTGPQTRALGEYGAVPDEIRHGIIWTANLSNFAALRFWNGLTVAQRRTAQSGIGLAFSALTPSQQAAFIEAMKGERRESRSEFAEHMRLFEPQSASLSAKLNSKAPYVARDGVEAVFAADTRQAVEEWVAKNGQNRKLAIELRVQRYAVLNFRIAPDQVVASDYDWLTLGPRQEKARP